MPHMQVSPQPPFEMTALSDELPIVFNSTYRSRVAFVAFASGLDVTDDGKVLLTYGEQWYSCDA